MPDLRQAIRIAVAGSTVSEPIGQLLVGVGREQSLYRIRWCWAYLTTLRRWDAWWDAQPKRLHA